MTFKKLLGKQMLFFDGATGTQLQARGCSPVSCRKAGTLLTLILSRPCIAVIWMSARIS